jgi:hypothetical protein
VRVQRLRVMGRRVLRSAEGRKGAGGESWFVRPGPSTAARSSKGPRRPAGAADGGVAKAGPPRACGGDHRARSLVPVPTKPPPQLIERFAVGSLKSILCHRVGPDPAVSAALAAAVAAAEGDEGGALSALARADLRARAAKVACVLLDSQSLRLALATALLPHLLEQRKAISSAVQMCRVRVPVQWSLGKAAAKRLRIAVAPAAASSLRARSGSELDSAGGSGDAPGATMADEDASPPFAIAGKMQRAGSGASSGVEEDSLGSVVTFAAAGKVHRAVALDVPAMVRGRHYWECRLLEDTRDDETCLLGISTLPRLAGTAALAPVNQPSEEHWLLQRFLI